jgi:hypothetical protein
MKLIQTQTLGSNQSTVVFSSIPSTYQNLMLFLYARTNRTGASIEVLYARFNTDTSSNTNYGSLRLIATTSSAPGTDTPGYVGPGATTDTSVSGEYGNSILMIPNYAQTNLAKLPMALNFSDSGSATTSYYWSQHAKWNNTAAINRIELFPELGASNAIYAGSTFSLYGL